MIDTSNWKKFKISDLFEIKGSRTTRHNNLSQNYSEINCYPYVTTAATNNGVSGWSNFYTEKGNIITIDSAVLGKAFYQEYNFTASDHVEKLIPKFNMNKMIACFIVTILDKTGKQLGYSYSKKRSQKALKEEYIPLPATSEGTPDWQYMESFMQDIASRCEVTIESENTNTIIDTSNWKKFKISDLFDVSLPRTTINKTNGGNGTTPFVSAKNDNNGIERYISINGDGNSIITKKNTFTINMFGKAFWHEYDFYAQRGGTVTIVRPKFDTNKMISLFILTIVNKVMENKYDYGNQCHMQNINDTYIILPVTSEGIPDWQYMENYMKSISRKCIVKINGKEV